MIQSWYFYYVDSYCQENTQIIRILIRMKFDIPDGDLEIQIFEAKGKKCVSFLERTKKTLIAGPCKIVDP